MDLFFYFITLHTIYSVERVYSYVRNRKPLKYHHYEANLSPPIPGFAACGFTHLGISP